MEVPLVFGQHWFVVDTTAPSSQSRIRISDAIGSEVLTTDLGTSLLALAVLATFMALVVSFVWGIDVVTRAHHEERRRGALIMGWGACTIGAALAAAPIAMWALPAVALVAFPLTRWLTGYTKRRLALEALRISRHGDVAVRQERRQRGQRIAE
jgi:hypothetical protein